MSFNREYKQHQEHAASILKYDFHESRLLENALIKNSEKRNDLSTKLSNMRIQINRSSFFERELPKRLLLHAKLIGGYAQDQPENLMYLIYRSIKLFSSDKMADVFNRPRFRAIFRKSSLSDSQKKIALEILNELTLEVEKEEDQLTLKHLEKNKNDPDQKNHYLLWLKQLKECDVLNAQYLRKISETERKLDIIYKPENISNSLALQNLCHQIGSKPIEILVLEPASHHSFDHDLASVILMRIKKAAENRHRCILLSFDAFRKIMDEKNEIPFVTKLSFLQHGNSKFDYVDNINHYAAHLPELTEIVLRGCGTAKHPSLNPPVNYKVKFSSDDYDKKPSIQGTSSLVVQQKEENGKILTKASWVTTHTDSKNDIHCIPDITSVSKIEKKPTEEQLCQLEQIKDMPFLKHDNDYINSARTTFFDSEKVLSPDEHASAKKVLRRARTESVSHSENDLITAVWNNMTPEQQQRISVKAYMGAYTVEHDRVVPSNKHDQSKFPKAVRIGPS